MIEEKDVDKELPDSSDDYVAFNGGLYEFETSAGWTDKWPQLTKEELLSRNSFGSDKERLANNKWLDKFISEAEK
ncbi:TPA: hypothetical protein LAN56_003450 [Escherichia coli]|nr:hypothetical protein [Escherichia coli]